MGTRHAVLLSLVASVGAANGPCRANGSAAPPGTPQRPTPGSAAEHFALLEFRVLNNTVLDLRQVERAVYPHLGPKKTIADVQAARADLEKAYREAGYSSVYVDIPEQQVEDGVVRLAVIEGRLNHVAVTGTRYFMNRRILAAVPSLAPGTVPHFPDVQKQVNTLNQASPDLSVAPILQPGPEPGTVDVDLKVKDQLPLHGSVEVNNRYTPDTSPARLNVNLSYDNLFQRYQTLSLQYQVSPQDSRDTRVLAGTYLAPLPSLGGTLALYAVGSSSDVATVGTLGVLGKGHVYGSRYIIPLTPTGGFSSSLTFGIDLKDFAESILLASSPALQTPVKYLNWTIAYGGTLVNDRRSTTFNIATDFGVRGLFNNPAEFEDKRYLANPDYMYWHLDATHVQPLPWGLALALRAAGQYTTEPLIDNEQFAVGGVESVRGYLEAEQLGDSGAVGSLELRTPPLARAFGIHPHEAYVYLFYDAGFVTLVDPLPTQVARQNLRSVGVGFQIFGYAGFDAGLDWARVLVATMYESADESRLQFHFRYGF